MSTGSTRPTQGIDVSKWQVSTPSLAGLDFLFARASIGTDKDSRYDQHIANARKAGLVTGAYHFNWDTLGIQAQVDAFAKAAGNVDFYFLDVEGRNAFSTAQTEEFIRRWHRTTGKKIGLYMSESSYKRGVGQDYHWVANWSGIPSIPFHFWQWQGSPLDKDAFNGTKAELLALAGGGADMSRYINMKSIDTSLLRRATVSEGQQWFYLDGAPGGKMSADANVPVVGRSDSDGSKLIVVIGTASPYADNVQRPTGVLVNDDWTTTTAPVIPPTGADCSAVEAELAAAKDTIDEQAATIAAEKQARIEAENSLAVTYANIDSLKG